MRLATKLALRIAALVLALVLIGAASLWGLAGLASSFDAASDDYEQLRAIYQVGHHASVAQLMLRGGAGESARLELARAMHLTQAMLEVEHRRERREPLEKLRQQLGVALTVAPGGGIHAALSSVAELATRVQGQIVETRSAAARRLQWTTAALGALLLVVVWAAVVVGVAQYRSVMRPLRRLEAGVRQLTDANFAAQIPAEGEAEFAHLAASFNAMAHQLHQLYQSLERQVEDKSRQLVESERLAGVGYLAAGLAHEINNPLAIIGGYAEAALRQMPQGDESRAARALRVIAEEAFRCKQITAKLLSLARPGGAERAVVGLEEVLDRVASLLGGLEQFGSRAVEVETSGELEVIGSAGELTQVFINLVGNALEATEEATGRVRIEAARRGGWVVVKIMDNGRGMDAATLARIFEPFFTDKPQRGQRGVGLGLSVSHAIVRQHGGRLTAWSDGPGRGSTFTVELPAATEEQAG